MYKYGEIPNNVILKTTKTHEKASITVSQFQYHIYNVKGYWIESGRYHRLTLAPRHKKYCSINTGG